MDTLGTDGPSESHPDFVDAPMILRGPDVGGFIRTNGAFRALVGWTDAQLNDEGLLHWIAPADQAAVRVAIETGEACRASHRTQSGGWLPLHLRGQGGLMLGQCASFVDLPSVPNVNVDTVTGTLETIARIVEAQNPGYRCSILLVVDERPARWRSAEPPH